jgi:hypothetical protein
MANALPEPDSLDALRSTVAELERTNAQLREELERPPVVRWTHDPLTTWLLLELLIAFLIGYSRGHLMPIC